MSEIDLAGFDLWAAQLLVDAAARDTAAVNGDFFTLDYIRDRIHHTLDQVDLTRLNAALEKLNGAVAEEDLRATAAATRELRDTVAAFSPAS